MEYFFAHPPLIASTDTMWCSEIASVYDYCEHGSGIDVGAGGRTLTPANERCDVVPTYSPDHLASAEALTFAADDTYDWLYSGHCIEHCQDTLATIREWLRVVKPGGHVCIVVPDVNHTRAQNTDPTPHRHEWAPREFLENILGWRQGTQTWYEARGFVPQLPEAELISAHVACPNWSFHVVLRKREVVGDEKQQAVAGAGRGAAMG